MRSRSLLLIMCLLIELATLSVAHAATVFLEQDTWLRESRRGENNRNDRDLQLRQAPRNDMRPVLQFDLSSLPMGARASPTSFAGSVYTNCPMMCRTVRGTMMVRNTDSPVFQHNCWRAPASKSGVSLRTVDTPTAQV